MPSIAELRRVTQPESVTGRVNAEHWAGRLYMRRVSPYATALLLRTPLSANGVTWLMIASGVLAAAVLTLPGVLAAAAVVVLVQAQLLFDCSDGEVARWRRTFSPAGIYLDRVGHYATESALAAALGVRADGGWRSLGGWTTLGLLGAVLVLYVKAETDLVHVARALSGVPPLEDRGTTHRRGALSAIRQLLRFVPFFRMFVAVEFSLLALLAALADALTGSLVGSRVFLVVLLVATAGTAAGHLASILASTRLR
jgi:phosphatidylglycerophosphate synthase